MELIKKFCLEILDKVKEHIAIVIVGTFFLIISFVFKTYLTTVYTFTFPLWGWVVLCAVISCPLAITLKIIELRRKQKVLTDADDIKGAINDWFNNSYIYCSFKKEQSIFFKV